MVKADIIIIKKDRKKEWFRFSVMSFLVISVATVATIVNEAYANDRPDDHDDLFIVKSIDRISEMQTSLFKEVTQQQQSGKYYNHHHQQSPHDNIIATIHGIEAVQILEQLERGNIIKFEVSYNDGDNGDPVIELIKVSDNIPDDKRMETMKKGL